MPFFGNKFTPKKTPPRKIPTSLDDTERVIADMTGDGGLIQLKLGNNTNIFNKGSWALDSGVVGNMQKENQKLRNKIEKLEEEKNMLLLKFEVLLNMCTQTTAESHIKDREIASLKKKRISLENK